MGTVPGARLGRHLACWQPHWGGGGCGQLQQRMRQIRYKERCKMTHPGAGHNSPRCLLLAQIYSAKHKRFWPARCIGFDASDGTHLLVDAEDAEAEVRQCFISRGTLSTFSVRLIISALPAGALH